MKKQEFLDSLVVKLGKLTEKEAAAHLEVDKVRTELRKTLLEIKRFLKSEF